MEHLIIQEILRQYSLRHIAWKVILAICESATICHWPGILACHTIFQLTLAFKLYNGNFPWTHILHLHDGNKCATQYFSLCCQQLVVCDSEILLRSSSSTSFKGVTFFPVQIQYNYLILLVHVILYILMKNRKNRNLHTWKMTSKNLRDWTGHRNLLSEADLAYRILPFFFLNLSGRWWRSLIPGRSSFRSKSRILIRNSVAATGSSLDTVYVELSVMEG